jgi:hypothetical protein
MINVPAVIFRIKMQKKLILRFGNEKAKKN